MKNSWERIEKIMTLNCTSPIFSFQQMLKINQEKPFTMVLVSSAMAKFPMPGYALYSASKSALEGFSRSMKWVKPDHVKIINVYPIATRTKFFDSAANSPPIPWPTQQPRDVAKRVVEALFTDTSSVYPSRTFAWAYYMNVVIPIILPAYALFEKFRLHRWSHQPAK